MTPKETLARELVADYVVRHGGCFNYAKYGGYVEEFIAYMLNARSTALDVIADGWRESLFESFHPGRGIRR